MEVINALVRNTIDLKRAELILRALHIAVRNVRRVRFRLETNEMIREAPNYPAPPKPAADSVHEGSAQGMTTDVATAHVGTATLRCPGGPAASGRSALASAPDPTSPKSRATQTAPEAVDPIQRKPPARAELPAEPIKPAARAAKGAS
jgi:hypothetical protein